MTDEELKAWPLMGYAPGDYMCRCCDCGAEFVGDKRAVQCLPCASKAVLALTARMRGALETAQNVIDGVREDLHSQRVADWYPEGANDAATSMSESMRLIGNRLADADLSALTPSPTDDVGGVNPSGGSGA